MRTSFQRGSLIRIKQKSGDIWRMRYRDGEAHRSEYIGTVKQYPTRAQASLAAQKMLAIINGPRSETITMGDLIDRFEREAMPARPATAHSYKSILGRIRAKWADVRIDQFAGQMPAVENWLNELVVIGRHPRRGRPVLVSPMYRGQVRAILHLLFEKAMLWNAVITQRNPIDLIRLKGSSQRTKELTILTLDQYQALLADEQLPVLVKTIIQIAAGLGLRISEILGLRWEDVDFEAGTLQIARSVVNGVANDTKTISSRRKLPLHENLAAALRNWRDNYQIVGGWLFGSERTGRPYDRDTLRSGYLQPAGERIGVPGLGFHAFRHTYRALMRLNGESLETQKNLMRHAKISTTFDVYGDSGKVEELRPANSRVIEMLVRKRA